MKPKTLPVQSALIADGNGSVFYRGLSITTTWKSTRNFQKTFTAIDSQTPVIYVKEVAEAVDYFVGEGIYDNRNLYPLPKIVFLDLNLSEGLGLNFLEWLKEQAEFKDIAFVGITESLNHEYKQIFSNYGLDFLIDLPLREKLFLKLIQSVYDNLTKKQFVILPNLLCNSVSNWGSPFPEVQGEEKQLVSKSCLSKNLFSRFLFTEI